MFRQDKNVQKNPLLITCQNISVNYQLKDQIYEWSFKNCDRVLQRILNYELFSVFDLQFMQHVPQKF